MGPSPLPRGGWSMMCLHIRHRWNWWIGKERSWSLVTSVVYESTWWAATSMLRSFQSQSAQHLQEPPKGSGVDKFTAAFFKSQQVSPISGKLVCRKAKMLWKHIEVKFWQRHSMKWKKCYTCSQCWITRSQENQELNHSTQESSARALIRLMIHLDLLPISTSLFESGTVVSCESSSHAYKFLCSLHGVSCEQSCNLANVCSLMLFEFAAFGWYLKVVVH